MSHPHPDQIPSLVYANRQGEIKDCPEFRMAGRSGNQIRLPERADLIPLPAGSELFVLPNRFPIGFHPQSGTEVVLTESPEQAEEGIQAVAAFMAPAHTAIHSAAFRRGTPLPDPLPLFAYTAVGWYGDRFWVSAFRSDANRRQDPKLFDPNQIRSKTLKQLKAQPHNRLIQHLGHCCLTYGCPAAKNYFLGRHEAPLPTSPACNAACLGCISLQPSGCCPSTQERIKFVPTAKEIAGVALPHLRQVKNPVVSFGQGCEGEPLLQAETIEKAITLIRRQTNLGTVNLNSNASLPEAVERLAVAGLDSLRVSMNSARQTQHRRYYRPHGFDFDDVQASIAIMKRYRRFVSLNYFILPGFTDLPEEFEALCALVEGYRPDLIQLRNLNMDPDWYLETVQPEPTAPAMGIRPWLAALRQRFPNLRFGYFNPALPPPPPPK